ncbi:hypothetical protein FSP39_019192 [Pinctada imbricata]|uniref:Apple domain-containing protein n=1 Tax=Pinctada imbricata TaxID=66713 RepID=A0AA88XZW8_PINIB|nr:hypothetical protein FSP39_019192 [Pinctada imbricata]
MFHPMAPITFVSFRDQYDNPAGIITIQNLLTLKNWNHVVIQRKYDDGHLRVYSNGILVADKDEMDQIGIPPDGTFAIGNSLSDLSQQFTGYISCLQIFAKFLSEAEMEEVWKLCKRERWKTKPKVYVIEDTDSDKKCLTDVPPPPPPVPYIPSDDNFLSVTSLVNENVWRSVREHYNWEDTGVTSGYFHRVTTNGATGNEVINIGSFNTTDLRTCSRLCMRIKGCKTFGFEKTLQMSNRNPCVLYDVSHSHISDEFGFKYFALRQ